MCASVCLAKLIEVESGEMRAVCFCFSHPDKHPLHLVLSLVGRYGF
jgi:hypothetical protein